MGDNDWLIKLMMPYDSLDLVTHFVPSQSSVCYAEANRHDLDRDDAHLVFTASPCIQRRIQLGKEVDVWVETDTNTVDEHNRFPSTGGMRAIPVSESLSRRTTRLNERNRSHREYLEKVWKGSPAKGKAMILQSCACQEVDKSNALVFDLSEMGVTR